MNKIESNLSILYPRSREKSKVIDFGSGCFQSLRETRYKQQGERLPVISVLGTKFRFLSNTRRCTLLLDDGKEEERTTRRKNF